MGDGRWLGWVWGRSREWRCSRFVQQRKNCDTGHVRCAQVHLPVPVAAETSSLPGSLDARDAVKLMSTVLLARTSDGMWAGVQSANVCANSPMAVE